MFEGRPGWNTLLVRSERGAGLVAEARAKGFLETESMPASYTDSLAKAALQKKQRAIRTATTRELLNVSQNGKRSALRIRPEAVDSILSAQ
jgi:coenzyme F420 hydrogenase subunit beta